MWISGGLQDYLKLGVNFGKCGNLDLSSTHEETVTMMWRSQETEPWGCANKIYSKRPFSGVSETQWFGGLHPPCELCSLFTLCPSPPAGSTNWSYSWHSDAMTSFHPDPALKGKRLNQA